MFDPQLITHNQRKVKATERAIVRWREKLFAEESVIVLCFFFGVDNGKKVIAECFDRIKCHRLYKSITYQRLETRDDDRYWRLYCLERWGVSSDRIDSIIDGR